MYFECQNHRKEYSKNAKLIQEWCWSRRKWCRRRHRCRYAPQSDWIQNNKIYILGAIANEKVDHTHSNAFNSVDRKVNKKTSWKKDQAKKGKIFIDNLWKRCEYIRFIVIWAWLNDAIAQFNAAVHFNNCALNSIAQANTHSHRKMHAKWNRIILILHLKTTWREWTQDARPENPTTLCAGF